MKVVIAGGSGFLGRPLSAHLVARRHEVVVLTRHAADTVAPPGVRLVPWMPDVPSPSTGSGQAPSTLRGPQGRPEPGRGTTGSEYDGDWRSAIDGADAVINLAGAGIGDKRWTAERKKELRDSRVLSTRSLVTAIRGARRRPTVFIQGSAVGYYGSTMGDEILDESFPPGSDFLGTLCVDWEAEARGAEALSCRLVFIRSGIALARDGGALKKMLPPFLFFVGGPMGSGRQYFSWVHRDDWIALVVWALESPAIGGVFNGCAPHPVTNADLSKAIGRAFRRPGWLRVPGFALRLLVGELADSGLLTGQRVVPKRALNMGFTFTYPDIDSALAAVAGRAVAETA